MSTYAGNASEIKSFGVDTRMRHVIWATLLTEEAANYLIEKLVKKGYTVGPASPTGIVTLVTDFSVNICLKIEHDGNCDTVLDTVKDILVNGMFSCLGLFVVQPISGCWNAGWVFTETSKTSVFDKLDA